MTHNNRTYWNGIITSQIYNFTQLGMFDLVDLTSKVCINLSIVYSGKEMALFYLFICIKRLGSIENIITLNYILIHILYKELLTVMC